MKTNPYAASPLNKRMINITGWLLVGSLIAIVVGIMSVMLNDQGPKYNPLFMAFMALS